MRRVLIYAVIYGSIGAMIGVCVALYTADVEVPSKKIASLNGSATKADKSHSSAPTIVTPEVAESTIPQVEEN